MADTNDPNATYREDMLASQVINEVNVEAAIQDLITAAGEQLSAAFDLDDYVSDFSVPDWLLRTPPTIPTPSTPSGYTDLDIPVFKFNPEDYLNADLLQRYNYESDFFDNFLDSRLRTYIDSQGYFLATEVQDALFAATRERDLQTLNDSLDAVDRVQARRGFPLPSSIHLAARNDVIKKYQDTYADRNKEITALIADKSLQEKMHAMDTSIKMEDIRSRFQLEYGKLYWQAADYLIRQFETEVRAAVAEADNKYKFTELNTNVDAKNTEADIAHVGQFNSKESTRLGAEMEELKEQVNLWKETYMARIEASKEMVKYYQSYTMGLLGSYNAIDYADKTE